MVASYAKARANIADGCGGGGGGASRARCAGAQIDGIAPPECGRPEGQSSKLPSFSEQNSEPGVVYSFRHSGRACRVPAPAYYSRLLCARARAALVPARYSFPLAFPTRLLLLILVSLLAPFVARYPFVAKYESYEHARYPYMANHEHDHEHPPGGHYPGCEHPRARALPGVRPRATPVLLVPLPVHVLVPVSVLTDDDDGGGADAATSTDASVGGNDGRGR